MFSYPVAGIRLGLPHWGGKGRSVWVTLVSDLQVNYVFRHSQYKSSDVRLHAKALIQLDASHHAKALILLDAGHHAKAYIQSDESRHAKALIQLDSSPCGQTE